MVNSSRDWLILSPWTVSFSFIAPGMFVKLDLRRPSAWAGPVLAADQVSPGFV